MKMAKYFGLAAAVLALATSVGCTTRLDRHWGESQRALVAIQTANPEAEVALSQPAFDGASAEKAVESHRKVDRSDSTISTRPMFEGDN